MSDYLQKIIYLTKAQYNTLQGGGTIGSQTGLNSNYLYCTTDENITTDDLGDLIVPVSKGGTGKTSFTVGSLLVGNSDNALTEIAATNSNTANTVVKRDASGNFSAGTITASLSGNATSASGANTLIMKSVDNTTLHNTSGTFAFSGSGAPWSGYDWVGLQVGSSNDKFQIVGTIDNNSLLFRTNDNGGTNTSWGSWQMAAHSVRGTQVGNSTQPVYMTSDGVITAGTALKALAYKDSLVSDDIPDNSANTTGNAATSTSANYLYPFSDGTNVSGTTNIQILQAVQNSDDIPRSVPFGVKLQHGNTEVGFGYFYPKNSLYGGWYIASYGGPSYVAVTNGVWETYKILTSKNTAAGTNNTETLTWDTTYTIAKINGTDIKFTTMSAPTTVSGNAGTATTLQNARTLWGQSFNGSANVTGNLIDVGNQIKLLSGETELQFLTSNGGAANGKFGKLGLNTTYANVDFTNYILDVNGKTRIGALDGGQHVINGNIQLNSQSGSYNEGLRINRSTTGYANIYLGGTRSSASGSQTGGWWIGTLSTPADATSNGDTITNTVFTISNNTADTLSIKGTRGATIGTNSGWAIRPRLAIGTTYDTNYTLKVAGMSWLQGPLRIGNSDTAGTESGQNGYATANSGSTNYIAFYGVYGDNPGYFNHTYIGESIYGPKDTANEKSELLLFKGNDVNATSGPDRIRLFANEVDIQVYTATLSGTWDTIRATTGTQVANFKNGQVTITGNILPEANNTRSLGSSSYKWANIYATTFNGNATSATTATTADSATNATNDENGNNIYDSYAKRYIQVIDLTADDTDTWYPVCINIPRGGLHRVACVNQLEGLGKPTWASHSSGYTAIVEMLVTAGGWGTTGGLSICLENDQRWLASNEPRPVGYTQFTQGSYACFWCRGGAKYKLLTDYIGTWDVYRESTTLSNQTVEPKTSYPDINFTRSTIIVNCSHANAANLTTTTNAIAYYTNAAGAFGTKASANGALYATSANGALQWGTLPIGQGGTGKTSWTQWGIVYASATDTLDQVTAGAAGNSGLALISNGAAAPGWYGGLSLTGTAAASWKANFLGTTDASSTTAAAVTITGGLGVAKTLYVGTQAIIAKIKIGNGTTDTQQHTITVTDNDLIFDAPSSKGFIFQQNATTKIRIVGYTCYPETSTDSSLGITGKRWETAYLTTSLLVGANSTGVNYNTNGLISFIGPGVISSCVTAAGNGYYLIGGGTQYGRWYIKTIGTANNGTTQGAQGEAVLEVGNSTPLIPGASTGGAHNSCGIIRIHGTNTYHTDILAQANGNNSCYLPNYDNDMFLVHAGSNDAIGSGKRPVYVAGNGRVTVCNDDVGDPYTPIYENKGEFTATSPVQYFTWSISSGKYGVSMTDDDGIFKDNTYSITLVVLTGESNLNAPLTWTSGNGTFSISTAVAVSGDVTGYAIIARGANITDSITFTQKDSNT